MEKPKVLVAVPGFAGIQPESQESYVRMMFRAGRDLPQYDFGFIVPTKREQFRARNYCVDRAIAGGFDYVLQLDDDHIVPSDLLTQLLGHMEAHPEYGVIGGLYYQRGGTYDPVVMKRLNPDEAGDWSFRYYRHYDEIFVKPGLYEVDIIGGGCMLFRTDVFTKLMPPYFWWEYEAGTDISICGRLKDAGVRIAIDTSIELGHLGNKTIVTSRTIGLLGQKMALINKTLRQDVMDYLGLNDLQLDREMAGAAEPEARKEKWHQSVKDTESWEDIKQYYKDHGSWHITNLLYWNLRHDRFKEQAIRLLDGKVQAGDHVLDYGPGIGHLTIPYLQHGCKVDIVEISGAPTIPLILDRARKHTVLDRLSHYGLNDFEIPGEFGLGAHQYKAAFLISVLDHLTNPYGVVRWITSRMAPGGYFICDYLAVGSDEENPQHLDRLDPATFDNFMHSLGWETSAEDMCLFIYKGQR